MIAVMRHPWPVLLAVLLLFAGTVASAPLLGEELLPKFMETDFLMHWVEKPGIGIVIVEKQPWANTLEVTHNVE